MFCTNCGKKIEDDAFFCENCGVKLVTDETDVKKSDRDLSDSVELVVLIAKTDGWITSKMNVPIRLDTVLLGRLDYGQTATFKIPFGKHWITIGRARILINFLEGSNAITLEYQRSNKANTLKTEIICCQQDDLVIKPSAVGKYSFGEGIKELYEQFITMRSPEKWLMLAGGIFSVVAMFLLLLLCCQILSLLFKAFFAFPLIAMIAVVVIGYWCYGLGVLLSIEYTYKRESKKLQLPEGMSAASLLEAFVGKFNYPYFKGVTYGDHGECVIEGKHQMYPIIFDEENVAELAIKDDVKAPIALLEAMVVRGYINKFFNPTLNIDVIKDMKKLKRLECQSKAERIVSAATSFLIFVVIVVGFLNPDWLLSRVIPGSVVRNGYLTQYSESITIEKAFSNFFDNGKWKQYNSDGYTNVVFTGTCTYLGERVDVRIVFKITGEKFIVDSLDINGREQNSVVLLIMLSEIYEDY